MDGMYGVSSFYPLNFLSEQDPDPYLCHHYGYSRTAGSGDLTSTQNTNYSIRSSIQICPTWTTTQCLPGNPCKTAPGTKDPVAFCSWGIMANMVLCVIPGQGNSKILNLVKSDSFDSPIFLYIPNNEKTSMGHLI